MVFELQLKMSYINMTPTFPQNLEKLLPGNLHSQNNLVNVVNTKKISLKPCKIYF